MIQLMYYYAYTNIKVLYHIKVVQTLTFSGIKCPVPQSTVRYLWGTIRTQHVHRCGEIIFTPTTTPTSSNPLTSHETVLTLFPSSGKDLVQQ
jgi:hypothetical protein